MTNQINQTMPNIATPVINDDGTMNVDWYRFFVALYSATGFGTPDFNPLYASPAGITSYTASCVINFKYTDPGSYKLHVHNQRTGSFIGFVNVIP